MKLYLKSSDNNTVFTDDLKSMVYLTDTEDELEITTNMVRRFEQLLDGGRLNVVTLRTSKPFAGYGSFYCLHSLVRFHDQNNDLRFSNFVFGPLVLRLLYTLNKPDLAYQLFTDKVT